MAVAVDDEEAAVGEEVTQPVALGGKGGVGVVVGFFHAVGADDGGGADEHLEGGRGGVDRHLKPIFLLFSPDGLGRAVGLGIGDPEIAALDQPDLQILPPAEGAVGTFAHRRLLVPNAQTIGQGQFPVGAGGGGGVVAE